MEFAAAANANLLLLLQQIFEPKETDAQAKHVG
jgi:hypothetical protein